MEDLRCEDLDMHQVQFIYDEFIVPRAPMMINIRGKDRDDVIKKFSSGDVDLYVFDTIQDEVIKLMAFDSLHRILKTKRFSRYWSEKESAAVGLVALNDVLQKP